MTEPRPDVRWNAAAAAAVVVAAVVAAMRIGGDTAAHLFTSDSAIPLLMSNAVTWTPFHLYYFGQDRFGALPFTFASLVHVVTGLRWTPVSLGALQVVTCLSGAFAFGKLTKNPPFFAAAFALAAVTLSPRFLLFDISQPYGWQLPLVFFAWWLMRGELVPRRAVLIAGVVFLACWQSALSAPILVGIGVVELCFAGDRTKRRAWLFAPILVGVGLELAVRGVYQLYAKRTFGHAYRTEMGLNLGGLFDSAWALMTADPGPGVALISVSVVVSIAAWVLVRKQQRDPELVTALAFGPLVLGQVFVLAASEHVRGSLDGRYLTIAEFLARLSLAFVVFAVARRAHPRGERAATVVALAALLASPMWIADPGRDPDQPKLRKIAKALNPSATTMWLVSPYWETYAIAALHPAGALVPVVPPEDYRRTPQHEPGLVSQPRIWVGNNDEAGAPLASEPPSVLFVGNALIERTDEPLQRIVDRTFATYRSVAQQVISRTRVKRCGEEVLVAATRQETLMLAVPRSTAVSVSSVLDNGRRVALRVSKNHGALREYRATEGLAYSVAIAADAEGRCHSAEALLLQSSASGSVSEPLLGPSP